MVILFFCILLYPVQGMEDREDHYLGFLKGVQKEILSLQDFQERENVLARTIDLKYLQKEGPGNQELLYLKNSQLKKDFRMNALALSIIVNKPEQVLFFLQYVKDINDAQWNVFGYRQEYNLACVALDGYNDYADGEQYFDLSARLAIIDILGKRGINWNFLPLKPDLYSNPPLSAGVPSGHCPDPDDIRDLRSRAILHGADPQKYGTSHYPLMKDDFSFYDPKYDECLLKHYQWMTKLEIPILKKDWMDRILKH